MDAGAAALGEELREGRAAGEEGVEERVEGAGGARRRERRVREGAAGGGGEAGAAVRGDDAAQEGLARAERGGEPGEDGLHGREEARGGELADDDVVAAEGVAERRRGGGGWPGGGGRGGAEEEAERGRRVGLRRRRLEAGDVACASFEAVHLYWASWR